MSLYGSSAESLVPPAGFPGRYRPRALRDIRDVGARYYTYVNTWRFSCALFRTRHRVQVLTGPIRLAGAVEDHAHARMLNRSWSVRCAGCHGLTAGELHGSGRRNSA